MVRLAKAAWLLFCTLSFGFDGAGLLRAEALRPPAVPLVTCDPYFSIWSFADRLTDKNTKHWTGANQSLYSMIRIDGKTYRIMGAEPADVPALPQMGLQVLPTRTIYDFEGEGTRVTFTFLTPLLPTNLDILSRPVTYLTWEVRSTDNREHTVSIFLSSTAELVVNQPDQAVTWSREKIGGLTVLRMGSQAQPILAKSGDNLRIDWGYLYAAAPGARGTQTAISGSRAAMQLFRESGSLPKVDDTRMPRPPSDDMPVLAFAFHIGKIGAKPSARHLILAYDDLYSIEYMHQRLRPYWRRNGLEANGLLREAAMKYVSLAAECRALDEELLDDLKRVGGEKYARIAALAYRQSLAAHKLVANTDGQPFYFPKENFSNGCIGTVDVIYPASPILLLLNPRLLKASLVPLFKYAGSDRWPFPFAPHDLGTYPLANGQVYGGREKSEKNQMPVEESANMLLMVAAIAKREGKADFAAEYWPLLAKWAEYLKAKGLDPENQLCTDDFAGHLAHNANLSLKAILALGGYSLLCDMRGNKDEAAAYRETAKQFAAQWLKLADDGDHYRLAFDRPGTWSQKYNLVWDPLLGLDLFPKEVARKEVAFYVKTQNHFGLPLDNRKPYTKLDWLVWSATLAESPADFEALIANAYTWVSETPTRVPLTDWYWTTDGKQAGFQARSVVGGVFVKMLSEATMWKKWSSRAK